MVMPRLSPAIKGFITAIIMIAFALVIDAQKGNPSRKIQVVALLIYGAGILWTLIAFRVSRASAPFSELFGQGFRCFIVVTLCMVIFTIIFIKMHPEFAETEAIYQREQLIKEKTKTPGEIDQLTARVKKQYPIRYISSAIFGYLMIGAGVTAVGSILLMRRTH